MSFPYSTLSIPTSASLAHSQRIPSSNSNVFRTLHKLSRASLLSLIFDWLDERNQPLCVPYLAEDDEDNEDDSIYAAARSLDELREIYEDMQRRKGGKREVVDRVLEGDWVVSEMTSSDAVLTASQ